MIPMWIGYTGVILIALGVIVLAMAWLEHKEGTELYDPYSTHHHENRSRPARRRR